MIDYSEIYNEYLKFTENSLKDYLSKLDCNPILKEGMAYSVNAGGKRVRPVLFFAMLDFFNIDYKKYVAFGCAIEFIHSYSLIHDDLPAMDNDDFRRGKPSNHKVFGEGLAILCGDALLNYAFEICADAIDDANSLNAFRYLAKCSGAFGMINGQAYDLCCEQRPEEKFGLNDESLLDVIDENKTGKLLAAPIVIASIIADRNNVLFEKLGLLTGKLFQYTDDVLDVESNFDQLGKTPGKDQKNGKLSAVSVFGLNGCKKQIEIIYDEIIKILKTLNFSPFFYDFYLKLKNRIN